MLDFDWQFWVMFLTIALPSIAAGWWLRGVKAEDDANRIEIERARWRHPSTQWEWEES